MNLNTLEKIRFFVQQFRKGWSQKIKNRVITIAYTLTANSAAVFSTPIPRIQLVVLPSLLPRMLAAGDAKRYLEK